MGLLSLYALQSNLGVNMKLAGNGAKSSIVKCAAGVISCKVAS